MPSPKYNDYKDYIQKHLIDTYSNHLTHVGQGIR